MNDFYQLSAAKPNGSPFPFAELKGRLVLIVNTATRCGLAPQFEGLEALHQKYASRGLSVLGFPCDQFAHQEPESDATVESVCKANFGVTFPLMAKCDVNGPSAHPVYQFLKARAGGFLSRELKWNFTKFLVDGSGRVVKRFAPTTRPEALEKVLLRYL